MNGVLLTLSDDGQLQVTLVAAGSWKAALPINTFQQPKSGTATLGVVASAWSTDFRRGWNGISASSRDQIMSQKAKQQVAWG